MSDPSEDHSFGRNGAVLQEGQDPEEATPRPTTYHDAQATYGYSRARALRPRSRCRSITRRCAARLRLSFHLREAGVIVRKLVEVRTRDLRRHCDIVIGHIGLRITRAVLEFDVHPLPELLEIERRSVPVDADPLARGAGLIEGKA
jgi:hypothetical protein